MRNTHKKERETRKKRNLQLKILTKKMNGISLVHRFLSGIYLSLFPPQLKKKSRKFPRSYKQKLKLLSQNNQKGTNFNDVFFSPLVSTYSVVEKMKPNKQNYLSTVSVHLVQQPNTHTLFRLSFQDTVSARP